VTESGAAFSFGEFQLLANRRLVLTTGERVPLGSRALEILLALIENHGRLVTKKELIARVWPNTVVDENNLKVHVSALRRALGDASQEYLLTDAGRGYRFVAPIRMVTRAPPKEPIAQRRLYNLPTSLTRLIGRKHALTDLLTLLERTRLVTIIGPGGVGKTRAALAVAATFASKQAHDVAFVELAPVKDPSLVPTVVAAALRLEARTDPLAEIIGFLRERHGLLVFDNCEHVVEAAARTVEAILKHAPSVRILATGRESLHAEGEHVYRLPRLELPISSRNIGPVEALCFPAIELFVERAGAVLGNYTLTDEDTPAVVEICRQLDGLALAIELAAARTDAFEPKELADRLRESCHLLTSGRRTAMPRHRTLRATLDWSYALLTHDEQKMLLKLAIFAGGFTLEAAAELAADGVSSAEAVVDWVISLVAKSLVHPEVGVGVSRYRLLETTRLYATKKLRETGEYELVARRHAEYFRRFLERAEEEWKTTSTTEWLAPRRSEVDNLRAALAWAFGPQGDVSLGFALASASVPLWVELSLLGECLDWIDRALASIGNGSAAERQQSALTAARGLSIMYVRLIAILRRVEARAYRLNNRVRFAHASYWLGRVHYVLGNPKHAVACARRSFEFAEDLGDRALAAQTINLMGRAHWLLSAFGEGSLLMERSIAQMQSLGNVVDVATTAAIAAGARALLGNFDQAFRHLAVAGEVANRLQDPFVEASIHFYQGVVHSQQGASELAIEEFEASRRVAERSGNLFRVYVSQFWLGWVLVRSGETDRARTLLEEAVKLATHLGTAFMLSWVEGILASASYCDGYESALFMCNSALARANKTGDKFGAALALRSRAEILVRRDPSTSLRAIGDISRTIELQREIGVRPELARSYITEANLLRTIGEDPAPRLMQAIELFDEMGMVVDRADAERLHGECLLGAPGSNPFVHANAPAS
jgi:predicted ATPase/DNA-binding winged helix-turn-helix (wHTH) protein